MFAPPWRKLILQLPADTDPNNTTSAGASCSTIQQKWLAATILAKSRYQDFIALTACSVSTSKTRKLEALVSPAVPGGPVLRACPEGPAFRSDHARLPHRALQRWARAQESGGFRIAAQQGAFASPTVVIDELPIQQSF